MLADLFLRLAEELLAREVVGPLPPYFEAFDALVELAAAARVAEADRAGAGATAARAAARAAHGRWAAAFAAAGRPPEFSADRVRGLCCALFCKCGAPRYYGPCLF